MTVTQPQPRNLFDVLAEQTDALITTGALIHAYVGVAIDTGVSPDTEAKTAFSWIAAMLVEGTDMEPGVMLTKMNQQLYKLGLIHHGPPDLTTAPQEQT